MSPGERVEEETTKRIRKRIGVLLERLMPRNSQELHRRLQELERENAELKAGLGTHGSESSDINPENIVWIFGSGRSGSTWLARMMEDFEGQTVWFEPHVGDLFDPFHLRTERRKGGKHFVLGERYKENWLPLVRAFVLRGAGVRFPEVRHDGYLMIKEPGGSSAAPHLMEALPESRMILLVRDPRDVVASWTAAMNKGGWAAERHRDRSRQPSLSEAQLDRLVRSTSKKYAQNVGNAWRAYESHTGAKVLVRYEELRVDTLAVMKRIYSTLEVKIDEGELAWVVEEHSFENIPEGKRGEDKFHRKAKPGGWREDLSPRQVEIVEKITAPVLEEFYPE